MSIIRHPSAPPEPPECLSEALEPGARWPGESDRAYAAFQVYRDRPPGTRSIRSVAGALSKSSTWIGLWSKRWSWVERVSAWDGERDRIRRAALLEEAEAAALRHAQQAQLLMQVQLWPAHRFAQLLQNEKTRALLQRHFDSLSPVEMAEAIAKGARTFPALAQLERGSRTASGQTAAPTGANGSPFLSTMMTDADRAAEVLAILQAAGAIRRPAIGANPADHAVDDELHSSRADA